MRSLVLVTDVEDALRRRRATLCSRSAALAAGATPQKSILLILSSQPCIFLRSASHSSSPDLGSLAEVY